MCVDVLVRPWEKLVMGMKVTEVGPLSFFISLARSQLLTPSLFVLLSAWSAPFRPRLEVHLGLLVVPDLLWRVEREVHPASTDVDDPQPGSGTSFYATFAVFH